MPMLADIPEAVAPATPSPTLEDLMRGLGDVPLHRVRSRPPVGTATEADLPQHGQGRRCELVDGTLVERAVGFHQDDVGAIIYALLREFARSSRLGRANCAPMDFRMAGGNVRILGASFTRRERLPAARPEVRAGWCPDLCVEVLSPSNTAAEMAIKRAEYFASGCRIVWEVETELRTVTVYTPDGEPAVVGAGGVLDGGDVLPGFTLPLAELWAEDAEIWPA